MEGVGMDCKIFTDEHVCIYTCNNLCRDFGHCAFKLCSVGLESERYGIICQ